MKITGFGIANYRSFGPEKQFIRDLGKVNIFIGKNNSGKSNVLRLLWAVSRRPDQVGLPWDVIGRSNPAWDAVDKHKMAVDSPQIAFSITLDDELDGVHWPKELIESMRNRPLNFWIGSDPAGVERSSPLDQDDLSNSTLEQLHNKLSSSYYMGHPSRNQLLADTSSALWNRVVKYWARISSCLIYIPAIREIRAINSSKDKDSERASIDLSGKDLIKTLRIMQHPGIGKDAEQKKFGEIEEMVRNLLAIPDLKMEIPTEEDDIHFTMHDHVRLPLASFGTGIHELVIICSALALNENCYVCIEEPEIHLHPELLRRFLQFLRTTSNTYFIATHSNVLLDADEVDAIYHVRHDGQSSRIERCNTNAQSRAVLRDLGYRASDLLQANGIIWVEGPSDRNYINQWLKFVNPKLIEGLHYSIMFYGGACLANVSFAENMAADRFIDLLRINPNVIVVIDRDGDHADAPLREYKERIKREITEDKCWITKGREIENYLPGALLQRFLEERFPGKVRPFAFGSNHKIDNVIKRALPDDHFLYSRKKREYSEQICNTMIAADLDYLDLMAWINRIETAIEGWNSP